MKLSDRTYIVILIIMIAGLAFMAYWNFRDFQKYSSEVEVPPIEIPEIKLDWEEFLSQEREGEVNWVSPDGMFQLTYSANWMKIDEAFLENAGDTGIILIDAEVLLFAYRAEIEKQIFSFLTISQVNTEKNLENIIKEMEENIEKEGGVIETTILETKDGSAILETISGSDAQPSFYSRGEIIFNEEKTYLIFVTTYQKDWPYFEEEAKKIFGSIELLP